MADMSSSHPSRTKDHKMKVRNLATGAVIERYPPDAREMVNGGNYEFVSRETPSACEILQGMGLEELQALGRAGGVGVPSEKPEDWRAAILPAVERGDISLGDGGR